MFDFKYEKFHIPTHFKECYSPNFRGEHLFGNDNNENKVDDASCIYTIKWIDCFVWMWYTYNNKIKIG